MKYGREWQMGNECSIASSPLGARIHVATRCFKGSARVQSESFTEQLTEQS